MNNIRTIILLLTTKNNSEPIADKLFELLLKFLPSILTCSDLAKTGVLVKIITSKRKR